MSEHGFRSGALPKPLTWALAIGLGLGAGWLLSLILPTDAIAGEPVVPYWLIAPFALLLACIALMPFVHRGLWHRFYPEVSLLLGSLIAGYYLAGYSMTAPGDHRPYGQERLLHAFLEYYAWPVYVRTPQGVRRVTGPR